MSKLDDIFRDYRETCFLARDMLYRKHDDSIDLLARQNIVSKQQIKDLMLELIGELNDHDWRKPINSDELRQKVEKL